MRAPRKKRKTANPWWLILLLLPIVGVGLGLWFGSRPTGVTPDSIAAVLPPTTAVVFTVNTTPRAWSFWEQSLSPPAKAVLQQKIDRLPLTTMLRQAGLEWQRDVQPWCQGIVGIALLDNDQDDSTAATVIIPARSKRGAEDFIQRYQGSWGQSEQRNYEGVIYQQTNDPDRSEVIALVKDTVVIASHPQALFQIVDVVQKRQPALREASIWQSARDGQTETADQVLIRGLIRQNASLFGDKHKLQELEAVAVAVAGKPQGLTVFAKTYFQQPLPAIPEGNSKLLNLLPEQTFFYLSGWQLGKTWSFLAKNLTAQTKLTEWESYLTNEVGLDLQRDVFSWWTGEWAVAAIPTQTGILGKTTGFGLVFLAEGEKEKGERFWQRLDDLAVNARGGLLPRGVTLQTKNDRTLWFVGKSLAASHGALGAYNFWAMGELGEQLKANNSLPGSSKWQRSVASLPSTNGGYFYLDMTVARTLFSNNIAPSEWQDQPWFQETMVILNSITSITFTQTRLDDRTTRLDGLILLAPAS
ncbi:MAG: DUF3352 domain-containing protein [Pseudanabaenaceae cyanobacterium]